MIDIAETNCPEFETGSKPMVLAIDDEPAILSLIEKLLKNWGYSTATAHNESECLNLWQRLKDEISIAIVDMRLNTLDGRHLAAELLNDNPDLKVIFMSGYPIEEFHDPNLEFGKNFVTKPFGLMELKKIIHHCELRRSTRTN